MDKEFKSWMLQNIEGWEDSQKQKILRLVQSEPEKAITRFGMNLPGWAKRFAAETKMSIPGYCGNVAVQDAPVLMEACRKHFADELAELK